VVPADVQRRQLVQQRIRHSREVRRQVHNHLQAL
jgi:hypothetical protein